MKNAIIALSILLASSLTFANEELTDLEKFEAQMERAGITYVLKIDPNGHVVFVFESTDPRDVCELADNFPALNVDSAINYFAESVAICKAPAGDAI